MSRGQPGRPRADRAFVYAPAPMLLFDAAGCLVDLNAACRELLGLHVAGCRGHGGGDLATRLAAVIEGDLLPPTGLVRRLLARGSPLERPLAFSEVGVTVSRCRFHSPRFGAVRLQAAEIPSRDAGTGRHAGSLLRLDLLDVECRRSFEDRLRRRWSHELTWETYAASYDRILPELPFYREVVERHRAAMASASIESVLDVGAGTGSVTVPLAARGKHVTAVEVNRAMLRRLSAKLDPRTRCRARLVEDTAERLPHVPDGSFDGVTALLSLFAMDDPVAALDEAVRALRPGGRLVVTEPRRCFDVASLMAEAERVLAGRGLLPRLRDDWLRIQRVAPRLGETIERIQGRHDGEASRRGWDAETLLEHLRTRGFVDLTFEESHLGHCATVAATKPGRR
jgi:ubiquinone/menaquinone biosynthesis C-methylase UbiE